ncbi:MAG: ATP-binding protein [Synergistaceae bacterium]|jgi:predicted AAA+ superfamily ATPase|nr:ATP-binding protein [Synergistaceae bacterium]
MKLRKALLMPSHERSEIFLLLQQVAADIIAEAESYCLSGDLWETFFALRLVGDENELGHAAEMGSAPTGSIAAMAPQELWALHRTISAARNLVDTEALYDNLRHLKEYLPSSPSGAHIDPEVQVNVLRLAESFKVAESPAEMYEALVNFYMQNGSGKFAIYKAFRWSEDSKLAPIEDIGAQTLDSFVGYKAQKDALLVNTEVFLRGMPAHNVLLFGDSGTGKSSSVRALLNEPGFARRGLRIIELRKDQLTGIPELLNTIRHRKYRFIIFMDDLSFEEYEVDYKFLKAFIEGGLERKPDNAVIYATSNRRNLVREVWSERKAVSDDVHGGDTMQERLSLADRFGLTIWYGAAAKDEYIEMVRSIANDLGVTMVDEEMESLALRWEVDRGGFTGRTARQFVQHMLLRG